MRQNLDNQKEGLHLYISLYGLPRHAWMVVVSYVQVWQSPSTQLVRKYWNKQVYLTELESLFPLLIGLDNAALRSSFSSSSKNPCEGSSSWWRCFDSWFEILLFEEITTALEELVVRLAVTAVVDEAVRGNEWELEFLAPALATWPKTMLERFNNCLLIYLSSPVCNRAIICLACLCRTNVIVKKSRVVKNEFHCWFEQ